VGCEFLKILSPPNGTVVAKMAGLSEILGFSRYSYNSPRPTDNVLGNYVIAIIDESLGTEHFTWYRRFLIILLLRLDSESHLLIDYMLLTKMKRKRSTQPEYVSIIILLYTYSLKISFLAASKDIRFKRFISLTGKSYHL
jgi:hypothetical protein